MPLQELNDKLHGRDVHLDRTRIPDRFDPEKSVDVSKVTSQFQQTEQWGASSLPKKIEMAVPQPVQAMLAHDDRAKKRRRMMAFFLGGIALVLLIGGILVKVRSGLFSEQNITIDLSGPVEIASAEKVSFDFTYANSNWVAINGATIVLEYPESFRPDAVAALDIKKSRAEYTLGTVGPQEHSHVTFTGKFYGSKGDRATLRATLRYNPSALSSVYEKTAERTVNIISSSLFFEINAPFELASDQEVQYEVKYRNVGDTSFSNLNIKLEYPTDFTFTDADPKPTSGQAVWQIGTLDSHQEGTIVVRGRLTGSRDEQKLIQGGIGVMQGDGTFLSYGENSRKTKIVASPFSIHQTVNGQTGGDANPGNTLLYEIEYRNDGNVGIRDAIISLSLDSPYVDWSSLIFMSTARGAYNQSGKVIFWKASDLPALSRVEPGQSGKVSFSLKTYPDVGKRFPGLHNPTIQSVAKIDSPDIPALVGLTKVVASATLSVVLNSVVAESFTGFYQDATIANSGPLPPRVGEETTYTFHLKLTNTLNDITDAQANIVLPSGIRYTGNKQPDTEKLVSNERANELIWSIGTLAAGSGRELVFQVAMVPDASSINKQVALISRVVATGKDSFTKKDWRLELGGKTTNLSEDSSLRSIDRTVQANQ
jgi:hypothetical protein